MGFWLIKVLLYLILDYTRHLSLCRWDMYFVSYISLSKIYKFKKKVWGKKIYFLGQSNRLSFQFKVIDSQFRSLKMLVLLLSVVHHLPHLVLNMKWSRRLNLAFTLSNCPHSVRIKNHDSGSHFGFHQLCEFEHINLPVFLCSPPWEKRALDWMEAKGSDHSTDISCLSWSWTSLCLEYPFLPFHVTP